MKLVVIVLILTIAITYGDALKCFSCSTLYGDGCSNTENMTPVECPSRRSKTCYSYITKDRNGKVTEAARGCSDKLPYGVESCHDGHHDDLRGCHCAIDQCNGSLDLWFLSSV